MAPTTRYLDPATRDVVMDGRRWKTTLPNGQALTPELDLVQAVLSTPLGSAGRDRTYGVEEIDNDVPDAPARWRGAVVRALSRWVARGTLRELVVLAEVIPGDGTTTLRSTISFKGRDGRQQSVELAR